MAATSSRRWRVDTDRSIAALAVGDLLAVLVFVIVGEVTHGVDPLTQPGRVLGTLAPFLIGLVIVASIGGLYTHDAIRSPKRALSLVVPGWIGAAIVAQALRATAMFPGDAALTFAIVSVVVGGGLLGLWRVIASLVF